MLKEFKIKILPKIKEKYNVIILSVPHKKIIKFLKNNVKKISAKNAIIFDIKYVLKKNENIIQL